MNAAVWSDTMSLQTVGQQWRKARFLHLTPDQIISPRSYALRGNASVPARATTQSVGASGLVRDYLLSHQA